MHKLEDEHQVFKIGTQVEVTSNEEGFKNSWYKCKIINPSKIKQKKRKKNHYWVEYETIVEEEDNSKAVKDYTHASFIRPLPPRTSACMESFEESDIVEANYRDGWWVGVVREVRDGGFKYLVAFVSPYEEIEFGREDLRAHLSWVGGHHWIRIPKKNAMRCPQDTNETVVALQLESIPAEVALHLKSSPAEVSAMERTPSPAKILTQATSYDAEKKRSSGWEIVQALTAPPLLQSCRLSSSEDNTNRNRKMEVSGRDSCASSLLSHNKIQGNSEKNDGISYQKKRRVGPAKKDVQKFLNSLQNGEEPGESGSMHESAIKQSPTSDAAGSHCRNPTKEIQVTEIIDDTNDVAEVVDEQGGCSLKAIVLYPDPALTESSKSHPAALGADGQPDKSRSWPFTKRSEMWNVIESMEIFKRNPQMPHFSPLNEHEENSREMAAICMMMKFSYEVERITAGFPDDLQNTRIIQDSLDNLKELESHGFSTTPLQLYLNEIFETIEREKELQENLKAVENGIRRSQAEKIEAERMLSEAAEQMKRLQAQIKHSETVKNHREERSAELESRKGRLSRELSLVRLSKKRHPFEW